MNLNYTMLFFKAPWGIMYKLNVSVPWFYHLKLHHGAIIVCFCKCFRTGPLLSNVFPTTADQILRFEVLALGLHVYSTPPEAKKKRWR